MKINPKLKKIAFQAVREGGKVLKKYFRKPIKIYSKKDLSLVTKADFESEKVMIKIIKKNFPPHNILAEESGGKVGGGFTWVIDPLDGTTNYVMGFPFFSVSLALVFKRRPILGIIYNPITDELYSAEENKGAYLNGKKIRVNAINKPSQALLLFDRGKNQYKGLKILTKLSPFMRTIRAFGGVLSVCQVSSGKAEVFFCLKPAYYDFAAGAFIAKEAGAKTTDFTGKEYGEHSPNLIIANIKLHKKLLKLIKNI